MILMFGCAGEFLYDVKYLIRAFRNANGTWPLTQTLAGLVTQSTL